MIDKALEETIASLKTQLEASRRNERRLRFMVLDAKAFVDRVVTGDIVQEHALNMQAYLAKET